MNVVKLFVLGSVLGIAACTSTSIQPSVAQFGTATVAAQNAESAFVSAINQKQLDWDDIHVLASAKVVVEPDGTVRVAGDTNSLPKTVIPADSMAAIDQLLKPIQAYGQAMQALSGDSAASTLDTNVDNIAKQASAFDASVLRPLGAQGLSSSAQAAVATAVKDIGNLIINALIARDVQAAAKSAQAPLTAIVKGLKAINGYWATNVPTNLSSEIAAAAVARWNDARRPPSYAERLALKSTWEKAATLVTADGANKALDALVTANTAIAANGPLLSKAEIESLSQAASDAYKAYQALAKE
jgi:hypothetical protein